MAFVELENGDWISPDFIEEIYKRDQLDTHWQAGNSVTVPVIYEIAKRLVIEEED